MPVRLYDIHVRRIADCDCGEQVTWADFNFLKLEFLPCSSFLSSENSWEAILKRFFKIYPLD